MTLIKKILKRKWLVVLIAIVFSVAIWKVFFANKGADVKSAKVEKGVVREELILSGEIKAEEHANLNFLSSGELNYIGVKEGQMVKKGDVLARLDSTNAYQTYLAAEADLRRYQSSVDNVYDQLQGHVKDESFTQIEIRTAAETNKDKAYRNFIIAKNNMANLSLTAPFDGVVTSVTHPFNGINTSLAESQIEIVNPNTLYFEVNADQTEVIKLRKGQKVLLVLDSFSEAELDGEISYISYTPKPGEVGTVYRINIRLLSQPSEDVKVGMSGDAKFVLSEKSDVLYLPPNYVNTDTKGKFVNTNTKKDKKYVEVGLEGEDRLEIKGDVKEGDLVFD